jgi:hypothetical protein
VKRPFVKANHMFCITKQCVRRSYGIGAGDATPAANFGVPAAASTEQMSGIAARRWTCSRRPGVLEGMKRTLIRAAGIVVLAAVTGAACVLEAVAAWPMR